MRGGRAVVLGPTGRNFGAGMSGGMAFVFDPDDTFFRRLNGEMVDLEPLEVDDGKWLREVLRTHVEETGSSVAAKLIERWHDEVRSFKKEMPRDYKRVIEARSEAHTSALQSLMRTSYAV